jgi:putative ABC transport system ATP-binding protein
VTTGTVIVDGVDVTRAGRNRIAKLRRERVGFIFQNYNLIPSLTVADNVSLPSRLSGRSPSRDALTAVLEAVGIEAFADATPSMLSGGQQQRVAIARALLSEPRLIFADEPTGALDSVSARHVIELMQRTVGVGRSLLLVTHDAEAAARADRVLVLRDGLLHRELMTPTASQVFDAVAEAA